MFLGHLTVAGEGVSAPRGWKGWRCAGRGQRPGVWDLFTAWWGAMGRLSPEFRSRGTWDPGKAVRKTCSRGLEERKEVKTIGGIRNSFRDAQTC